MDESLQASIAETFGARVKEVRESRQWSQSELARQMQDAGWKKYNQVSISRTEEGSRTVRLDEALGLSLVLGVNLEDLLIFGNDELDLHRSIDAYNQQGERLAGQIAVLNEVHGYLTQDVQVAKKRLSNEDLSDASRERLKQLIVKAEDALQGDIMRFVNLALVPFGYVFPYVEREPVQHRDSRGELIDGDD